MFSEHQSLYFAHWLTLAGRSDKQVSRTMASARVDMNPHQVEAACFALQSPLAKGVLLADEVGLGKTIEAGLVMAQKWAEKKRSILLVVPASLRKQWNQELVDKFELPSVILDSKIARDMRNTGIDNPFDQADQVVICSYEYLSRQKERVQALDWHLVVFDEAHKLRNLYKKSGNKITRNIHQATLHAESKVLLSATPIQNNLMELYGLAKVMDEHFFGDDKSFKTLYVNRQKNSDSLEDLKQRIKPLCHRTLRRQVQEEGGINFTNRYSLLKVLGRAFDMTESLGGARKAVIFTESCRTQQFIKEQLETSSFNSRVVLLNGSNSDPDSRAIYKDWVEEHAGTARISGSKTADMKAALVDRFRSSAERYYHRIGSTKQEMKPEVLARLFQQRSQSRLIRFDEQAIPTTSAVDIDPSLLARFLKPDIPQHEQLRKLHLLVKGDDGEDCLSVAGALLLTVEPTLHLPSSFVQCVAYRGTERTAEEQLDYQDFTGPLDSQIQGAYEFVRKNMRIEAVKTIGRIDIPQYHLGAVYEAIVNAVAHRDYSMAGNRIRIHLFSDRMEIASPGLLPNNLTIDSLSENTVTRNETIVNLLSRYYQADPVTGRQRPIERRGKGVPRILKESQALSTRMPEYRIVGERELVLTI